MAKNMDNPLLDTGRLPALSRIKPEHIEPAIDFLLQDNRRRIYQLLKENAVPTWDNTLQALEELDDRLNRAWSPASHLHAVRDNEALRAVYNNCLPKLSEYATDMGQNEDLYRAYVAVAKSDEYKTLSQAQRRIIDHALRDFRLAGIELEAGAKKQCKEIQQKLARLQAQFEENVLDATHAWKKHITDRQLLAGLPETALALAAQNAHREGLDGWVFTLEYPAYMPVMQYADNAALRKEMYVAYVTRASGAGPPDRQRGNTGVMGG